MIKLYYNVGGLFKEFGFEFVELFCMFFKDEVCKLGVIMDVSRVFLVCYLFLGLGFVVCIFGDVIVDNVLDILRCVDEIYINIICEFGIYDDIW